MFNAMTTNSQNISVAQNNRDIVRATPDDYYLLRVEATIQSGDNDRESVNYAHRLLSYGAARLISGFTQEWWIVKPMQSEHRHGRTTADFKMAILKRCLVAVNATVRMTDNITKLTSVVNDSRNKAKDYHLIIYVTGVATQPTQT